nr:hypothetical protein [Tanacetum cinerariifolium]
ESLTYARNPVKEILRKVKSICHSSILTGLQGTLKGKWRYLILAKSPIHNHVLIPNYQYFKIQDFCYSDGYECFQAINIGRYEHQLSASILPLLLLCDYDITLPSHTVKTDMVIHTAKTEMMKLVVEIECVSMNADEFDKETGSSDGLQPTSGSELRSCIKQTSFA